jgi:RNA recognition motif-containing protein
MDYCKIFVGNIPFQCNDIEFTKCFENMIGFIKAEIIFKSDSKISRGFGFITFNNKENANNLLINNTIIYRDRLLRFTEYELKPIKDKELNTDNIIVLKNGNYIIVRNLYDITRDDLYNAFNIYAEIGKYFIASDRKTGLPKNYGIIEILNNDMYESLLNKKEIYIKNNIYDLARWKI